MDGRKERTYLEMETIKIYVWPDGSWISEEDDLDWYISSSGKGDDFTEYEVPLELDSDDIDELIALQALPGMLPDTKPKEGKIKVPEGATVIISHSKDIDYNAVTMLEDRLIINAPNILIEIIKGNNNK